jgi:hypothetical protein
MKQVQLIQKITDLFLQFSKEVKDKGKLKLTDINIVSEDVLVPILSIIFDTDLKNLNLEKANYPGIDLATDEHITYLGTKKKIAFQITSTNNIEKIKKTLNSYVAREFYKKFDEIYIYNLIEKQDSYQKASIIEVESIIDKKFSFDLSKNIIDKSDLEKIIKTLSPISEIETICKLLEDQFIYRKKSLLSFEIWESDGKLGYGFSNLLNSIDLTTHNTLIKDVLSDDAKHLLHTLFLNYNSAFNLNYENEKSRKFENLGFNTYLKAGFTQALNSFLLIKDRIITTLDKDNFSKELATTFNNLKLDLKESDFPLVNQPINHPAIQFIKTTVINIFTTTGIDSILKDEFIKDFNQNIQKCIIETFGQDDYEIHREKTINKWIRENEQELLQNQKDLNKLGFIDEEELQYQETYGFWRDIREYGTNDEVINDRRFFSTESIKHSINAIEKYEEKLKPVGILIDEYFDAYKKQPEGYLNNILFLIADFGKGKTSFLHHYASKLSEEYLRSHEGLFPVYINLNEYDKFTNSPSLGIIANYLAKRFKIDIKDEYFKKKDYFFLIDSLDECGELTETNINNVIKDIIEIQNLDNINQQKNRILIASRPIANGLKEKITKYNPFKIEIKDELEQIKAKDKLNKTESKSKANKCKEYTDNFISIYGFKKEQFDKYLEFALKKYLSLNSKGSNYFTSFSKKIFSKIEDNEKN